uniref:Protein FAR1-RELATED SEQUENCE n=1 Tax=Lactuca sativa TaxID=4236 RepID=A0A9R1VAA9_LACSA|nr:hypothetical protein LSAT_V11C600313870 [Lactuca sativa]
MRRKDHFIPGSRGMWTSTNSVGHSFVGRDVADSYWKILRHILFSSSPHWLEDDLSGYVNNKFVEKHNHVLGSKENLHLLSVNRKLDVVEQSFIHKLGAYNISATRAYTLSTSINGGYNVSGGTVTDFKNFKMDLNVSVGKSDAQMLIEKMEDRVKYVPNFFFDHKIDKGHVTGLFWADEASRRNYKEFGYIVSFDVT